jgi:hypothetical protein
MVIAKVAEYQVQFRAQYRVYSHRANLHAPESGACTNVKDFLHGIVVSILERQRNQQENVLTSSLSGNGAR